MKVSLISTVRNEAATAGEWLDSLLDQTRWPDEVVITDGGSTDNTVEILRESTQSFPIPLKVLEAPGANIARGRNIAIQNASHSVIACSDFGCILDENWLRFLIEPFEVDKRIELSAGYYQIAGDSTLDRLCSHFFGIDLNSKNPQTFLPSSRSLAIKKTLWAKAGSYPEWLTHSGEDTLFDYQAKSQQAQWAFVPEAHVTWRSPKSLSELFNTYFRYSRGDGETGTNAELYWYKTVEVFWTFARRLGLLLFGILLTLMLGYWSLIYWAAWLIIAMTRFLKDNLPISKKLGIRFYPYTTILEILGAIQVLGFSSGVRNRPKLRKRQIKYYRNQLHQILARHPDRRGGIVYPPTHDWGFMFQRPHQMARAFARQGYLFFYCTANAMTDSVFGFEEVETNLFLSHVPLETFGILDQPFVYLGSAWNRSTLNVFDQPRVIYDHYDDLEVSGAEQEDHMALLQDADIVLVTSHILLEAVSKYRPNALLTPNGVDIDWIRQNRPVQGESFPPDWKSIADKEHPVIGYSGALAEWFDYDLLHHLAITQPNFEFVLVGVDYDGSLERSKILEQKNIHWLGMKDYNKLFEYVWRFDVGIIPFKLNHITLATSPIKMFEYMACRKPVIATALPECKSYPGIFIAESYEQFSEHIEAALLISRNENYLALTDTVAGQNTWDRRVEAIIAQIYGSP